MKFAMVVGFFLALLVQASLQYPHHHKKHPKFLIVPETTLENVFGNSENKYDETSVNEEEAINEKIQNSPNNENSNNIILLNSEDLMNLYATNAKFIDNFGFKRHGSGKRYRRELTIPQNFNFDDKGYPAQTNLGLPQVTENPAIKRDPIVSFEKGWPPQANINLSEFTEKSVQPEILLKIDPLSGNYGVGGKITDKSSSFEPKLFSGIDTNGNFALGAGFKPSEKSDIKVQYEPQTGRISGGLGIIW